MVVESSVATPRAPPTAITIELKKVDGFWIPAAAREGSNDMGPNNQNRCHWESPRGRSIPMSDWLGASTSPCADGACRCGRKSNRFARQEKQWASTTHRCIPVRNDSMEMNGVVGDGKEYPDTPRYGGASRKTLAPKMISPSTLTPPPESLRFCNRIGATERMILVRWTAATRRLFHQSRRSVNRRSRSFVDQDATLRNESAYVSL